MLFDQFLSFKNRLLHHVASFFTHYPLLRSTFFGVYCLLIASLSCHPDVQVAFNGFEQEYPVVCASPSENAPRVAYINFREDLDMLRAASKALAKMIPVDTEAIVALGDKANGLATLVALKKSLPLIILTNKATLEGTLHTTSYASITSGHKKMFISPMQAEKIYSKKTVLLDDIISTGSSMKTALQLCKQAGAKIQAILCAGTEGEHRTHFENLPLKSLFHLPVY